MGYIGLDGIKREYWDTVNQDILRQLVRRDIIHCVSSMISAFLEEEKWFNELADVLNIPDYEGACENNDINVYYSNACEAYMFEEVDGTESECFDTYFEACQAAADHYNLDCDYREALEHWAVTKWLGEKLQAHGEMVIFGFLDFEAIWGRTTSGQAILLDHVIGEIAEEMEILEGQKWDWSKRD
jgi:hypothetical protein